MDTNPAAAFLPSPHLKTKEMQNPEGKSSKSQLGANSIFAIHVVGLIPQNGERVLVVQKLYAMLVASGGRRRCANSRRRPKQVIRISFRSTTQYLLSFVAIIILY